MEISFNAAQNLMIQNAINGTNHTHVDKGMNIVFASLSAASFIILSILILIQSKKDEDFSFLPYSNGILFFCSLVTLVADFSMNKDEFYYSYTLSIIVLIGIFVNIIGSRALFRTPNPGEDSLCGINHASIGILIWGITVPLALLEMLMAFCMLRKDNSLFAFTIIAAIFQKIIQVTIFYFGIRHKVPVANKHGTSLFLKLIAIYNFAMWLQSIIEGNNTMQEYLSEIMMDGTSAVVASVYAALTIDYRLLCFLLFTELAIEVDHSIENQGKIGISRQHRATNQECNMLEFRIQASEYTGCGYVVGLVLLGTQCINALQFLKGNPVTPIVNVFGMFADVLVIIQGVLLLTTGKRRANDSTTEEDPTSKGVDVMVGLMGVVGIAFWILKCSLILFLVPQLPAHSTDPRIIDYLIWTAAKFVVRIIGLPFQLYFFCRITNSFGCREIIRNKRTNYFILPCLMLSQLSIFVNAAIDSYSYILERYVKELNLSQSMVALYDMGEPLYLGFVLHVFFRFLIVNNNLRLMPARERFSFLVGGNQDKDGEDDDRKKEQEEQLLGHGSKFHSM